ncbi:epoxide hydrolase [Diaporthe helianthi]|uniref:Epoxide hydrolase n=1 Tax=Diaporthe helianthi TaxID=158607 RepID=A0A2P5IAT2_DIAHE|nr:epoxide hydrolase [Diaporthe helianthi]
MVETEEAPQVAPGDEVKPYKIHVSSRYLDLTKQKLELTRLPHESTQPPSEDWWEPKSQVEPLIDFWLEKYSWREQEESLNKTPQFRTSISIPSSETPIRLHFIHVPSPHSHALPLLLLPPFPFSNLALVHLVKPFTEPDDASLDQPFHLVIPALPGIGFSDPFPNNTPVISATLEVLNTLMLRLGYEHYLVSNSGAAQSSPARIDWKLIEGLSSGYPSSCLGAHLISPPLCSPKLSEAPLEWAKWTIANVLNAPILGYSKEDLSAHKQAAVALAQKKKALTPSEFGLNNVGLKEPNTLAYAMCDSPTGLLVFALKGLRLLAPRLPFTPQQIITFTNLAWLPGPEYAMRFWAHCATHDNSDDRKEASKKPAARPRIGITVFLGETEPETETEMGGEGGRSDATADLGAGETTVQVEAPTKADAGTSYVCPAWANAHYSVLFSQRTRGLPGLLAWERPHVILTGLRGLSAELLKVDSRFRRASPMDADNTVPMEGVTSPDEAAGDHGGLLPPPRPILEQGDSSRTQVASQSPSSHKGKEPEMASPSIAAVDNERNPGSPLALKPEDELEEERSIRGGTPDTVVLVTAPKVKEEDAAK